MAQMVTNPSKKGDVVVLHYVRRDYMINPYREMVTFEWRVGIVRTLKRDGRPSRVEWLQGRWDFQKRETVNLGATRDYAVAPRTHFHNHVTDADIEAAVALQDFKDLDGIRAALEPLVRRAKPAA